MELNQLRYPFAEQASQINGFVLKEKKKAYIAGLGRDQLEHLASPMTKSETSPSPNTNESETIEKRLEYYSPSVCVCVCVSQPERQQVNVYCV